MVSWANELKVKFDWACDSGSFLHVLGNSLASTCWLCAMRELLKGKGKKKDNFFLRVHRLRAVHRKRERLKWRGGRVKRRREGDRV